MPTVVRRSSEFSQIPLLVPAPLLPYHLVRDQWQRGQQNEQGNAARRQQAGNPSLFGQLV
jgi:hypothetical protein